MQAPMPMVTFFKTLEVSRLVKISRRKGFKFNMLMCYCIGRAASCVKEFYLLPVGDKLMQYDSIAVNTIVANSQGEVSSCDLPYCDDLRQFNADYVRLTRQVAESCRDYDLSEKSMVIGTSALARYEIDGAVECIAEYLITRFLFGENIAVRGSRLHSCCRFSFTTRRWMAHTLHTSWISCNRR